MSIRGVFVYILVATWFVASAWLTPADSAAQSGFVTETVDSTGDVGWQTSTAIDHYGFPHIGYIAPTPLTDLKYARKSATGWSVETASAYVYPMSATSLVLDANDNPAMVTGGNEALYIFKDGSSWTVEESADSPRGLPPSRWITTTSRACCTTGRSTRRLTVV